MSLEVGQIIESKYRINRLIGEGGMGAVYEGENVRINRRVAIKVLHAAFTGNAEVMQRFEREAQAAGRIGRRRRQDVITLHALADAPVRIQQVAEVLDVDAELAGVAMALDVLEDVLRHAQVHLVQERKEYWKREIEVAEDKVLDELSALEEKQDAPDSEQVKVY